MLTSSQKANWFSPSAPLTLENDGPPLKTGHPRSHLDSRATAHHVLALPTAPLKVPPLGLLNLCPHLVSSTPPQTQGNCWAKSPFRMGESMAPFALLFHLTPFLVEETEVQGQGVPCISRPCQRFCPHLSQANLEGSDPAWVISPPSAMYNILPGFQLQISQLKTNHSFLEGQVPRPQTWHNRCFLNTRTIGRETEM